MQKKTENSNKENLKKKNINSIFCCILNVDFYLHCQDIINAHKSFKC